MHGFVQQSRPASPYGEVNAIYIDLDLIIQLSAAAAAVTAFGAALRRIWLWFARQEEQNARQWHAIHQSQEEQTLICYGVRACLMGLVEQGCDGPCKDALNKLDKHLNKAAHQDSEEDR